MMEEQHPDMMKVERYVDGKDYLLVLWKEFINATTLETLQEYKSIRDMVSSFATWCQVTGKL